MGRIQEVMSILRKASLVNNKELPHNIDKQIHPSSVVESESAGVMDLFRTRQLRKNTFLLFVIWFSVYLVYYGLVLNVGNIGGDLYINSVSRCSSKVWFWEVKQQRRVLTWCKFSSLYRFESSLKLLVVCRFDIECLLRANYFMWGSLLIDVWYPHLACSLKPTKLVTWNHWFFIFQVISGLVEIPGIAISIAILLKMGRRWPLALTMILAGVACLFVVPIPYIFNNVQWLITSLAMLAKFSISSSNAVMPVFTAELYPTTIRNIGVGASNVSAGVALMIVPYLWETVSHSTF